ncbi:AAA family ATPase, partial [bacterium]|nr:AAA family ATPase [bacterium]
MINTLQIKNFILVKDVAIEFKKGLNIITGETGAGKSTIIGSINLLIGKKADISIIGKFSDKTSIQGVFSINNPIVKTILKNLEIDCEDNEIIIRRVVLNNGKSKAYINDILVNNNVLKEIGAYLIDLHGQHDHQSLLDPKNHIEFLDNFIKNPELLNTYCKNFTKYKELLSKKQAMEDEIRSLNDSFEYLKFQEQELDHARLNEQEIEDILKQRNILKNYSKFNALVTEIKDELNEKDDSIICNLQKVQNNIKAIVDFEGSFTQFNENIEDIIC